MSDADSVQDKVATLWDWWREMRVTDSESARRKTTMQSRIEYHYTVANRLQTGDFDIVAWKIFMDGELAIGNWFGCLVEVLECIEALLQKAIDCAAEAKTNNTRVADGSADEWQATLKAAATKIAKANNLWMQGSWKKAREFCEAIAAQS